MKQLQGRAFLFGSNIDTDQIFPGKYLELTDSQEIANHAMEGADPQFASQVSCGDIIVAQRNFGCGSSREHAVITLKERGVGAVIAQSFGRIFYRNAINLGFPLVAYPQELPVQPGDIIAIDLSKGIINLQGKEYSFVPFPPEIRKIMEAGGIIPVIRSQLKE